MLLSDLFESPKYFLKKSKYNNIKKKEIPNNFVKIKAKSMTLTSHFE